MVNCYTGRQVLVAFISSLSSFIASVARAWATPLIVKLQEPNSEIPLTPDECSWVVSLNMVGHMISAVPVGFFLNKTGRKPLLFLIGITETTAWIVPLAIRNASSLCATRILQGITEGAMCSCLPVYLGEIAGTEIRGSIGYFFLGLWHIGSVYAYTLGAYFSYSTIIWLSMAPCILFLATLGLIPESPYYLVLKGKTKKAEKILIWLRGANKAAEEIERISESIKTELDKKESYIKVLSSRNGRKAFAIVMLVDASYVFCGGPSVFSYATDTFSKTKTVGIGPFGFTIIMGCVVLCLVPISSFVCDYFGRRVVLLASLIGGALFLTICSLFYYLYFHTHLDLIWFYWVPCTCIICYLASVGAGISCIASVLQTEVFSSGSRAAAGGLCWFAYSFMAFISVKLYHIMQDVFGLCFLYGSMAGVATLGSLLIFVFVPETKGKTFDEIQDILGR